MTSQDHEYFILVLLFLLCPFIIKSLEVLAIPAHPIKHQKTQNCFYVLVTLKGFLENVLLYLFHIGAELSVIALSILQSFY